MSLVLNMVGGSGGGGGITLVVTCASDFAGKTITCTDGVKTLTGTCPSSSPYEVEFSLPNTGTWTVSGTISGQTFTTTVTVTDETANLSSIPDGATVTPTDDVQILLHCANIWDKNYTTISQLLADTTSFLAVISDNNAVDYLVRSTTFASDICADSTAMSYIGADNYCADTLLSDSTWSSAICNSTYFESVLNVKVPTLSSDNNVLYSSYYQYGNYYPYYAFDGNDNTFFLFDLGAFTNNYIGYSFETFCGITRVTMYANKEGGPQNMLFTLQGSNDNSTWNDVYTLPEESTSFNTSFITTATTKYSYWRLFSSRPLTPSGGNDWQFKTIQFYGRKDV